MYKHLKKPCQHLSKIDVYDELATELWIKTPTLVQYAVTCLEAVSSALSALRKPATWLVAFIQTDQDLISKLANKVRRPNRAGFRIEEGTDITPQVFLMLERFRKANRDFGGTSTILITGLCRRPFKGNQHGFDMRQDETIWRAKSPTLSASTYDGVLSLPQMGTYVQGHG